MAREEHDRENLLADATSYAQRVSLWIAGREEEIFVGFRRDGAASFYFGADRVYHFNSHRQLRRGFVGHELFKAENGKLISLERRRTDQAVELVSRALDEPASREFLAEVERHIGTLAGALAAGAFTLIGNVPGDVDVIARLRTWLDEGDDRTEIAGSPRAN